MESFIKVKNLTFQYKGVITDFKLGPISFDIEKGKLYFFSGNNGSGKTTLAKILTGNLNLPKDNDSIESEKYNSFYYNQLIEENIFSELTVKEHLTLFEQGSLYTIKELIEMFPVLNELQTKYPDELSGGQNQLLGFCTIICKHFDLVVFDEVLNHLDNHISEKVLDIITNELIIKRNTSVIIIAHNFNLLKNYCDSIINFENGKITINAQNI